MELRQTGRRVNRKRVQRLTRMIGLETLGPKPKSSQPAARRRVYPNLPRGLAIDQPNQVRAADITYIPMVLCFLYLVVASWRWTGTAATSWPGAYRTRWIPRSARRTRRRAAHGTAKDLQHRPSRAIHQCSVCRQVGSRHRADQHGPPQALIGQCFRRAAVAQPEVRRGPREGLHQWSRWVHRYRPVVPLL